MRECPHPAAGRLRPHALTRVADERHRQIEQYVDRRALRGSPRIALPRVRLAEGAHGDRISAQQAALVANHAARSACLGLAPHARLQPDAAAGAIDTQLVVTAIEPTSGAAAGASSLVDYFVPGPARLPVGLGGLALEAELRDPQAGQLALVKWARGANAVTDNAKLSPIGDAWQLAGRFGKEFARLLLDSDPARAGLQRKRLADAVVKANRALCAERYGSVNLAGRGASIFLPLAPEAIDPGPPGINPETR
jgi:hypothetical protein